MRQMLMTDADHALLQRCLQLAQAGGTRVAPNPKVGAVIVHQGRIIGEGYHAYAGGPHAEVNAVNVVNDKTLLQQATLYVSLEPCCFFGKTPPCTDLILQHRIPRVVVGCLDPNPRVAGQGIARLRERGVEVLLAADALPFQQINRAFFFNQRFQRPFISLKWAQSADGFIAGHDAQGKGLRTPISGYAAAVFTHRLRAEHQTILIGSQTANSDNPRLDTRLFPGNHPRPIILGQRERLAPSLHVLQHPGLLVSESVPSLEQWLKTCYDQLGISSMLVEGGRQVLQQFIDTASFDAIYRYQSPQTLGAGIAAPRLPADWQWDAQTMLGQDLFGWYQRPL